MLSSALGPFRRSSPNIATHRLFFAILLFLVFVLIEAQASEYFEDSGQSILLRYEEYKGYNPIVISNLDANKDGRMDLVIHF